MITQIVTLVGVLIGALTAFLATTMAERARYQRAMTTRWDERKLDTYIEYASCVKEISSTAKRARQAEAGTETHAEYFAAMEAAELRRSVLFETLVLLASPAAIKAAHEVNLVLWQEEIATRNNNGTPVQGDLVALMNDYHERARIDLGIPRSPWQQ